MRRRGGAWAIKGITIDLTPLSTDWRYSKLLAEINKL